jgi:hypothetical protein
VETFSLDADDVRARLDAGARASVAVRDRVHRRIEDGAPLDVDDLAVLWHAPLDATAMQALAEAVRARQPRPLETFSPLYITNTCDAECLMCRMRRDNDALELRPSISPPSTRSSGSCSAATCRASLLLTGEYRAGGREWAIAHVNQALHRATALGFRHVLINIGALDS